MNSDPIATETNRISILGMPNSRSDFSRTFCGVKIAAYKA